MTASRPCRSWSATGSVSRACAIDWTAAEAPAMVVMHGMPWAIAAARIS